MSVAWGWRQALPPKGLLSDREGLADLRAQPIPGGRAAQTPHSLVGRAAGLGGVSSVTPGEGCHSRHAVRGCQPGSVRLSRQGPWGRVRALKQQRAPPAVWAGRWPRQVGYRPVSGSPAHPISDPPPCKPGGEGRHGEEGRPLGYVQMRVRVPPPGAGAEGGTYRLRGRPMPGAESGVYFQSQDAQVEETVPEVQGAAGSEPSRAVM